MRYRFLSFIVAVGMAQASAGALAQSRPPGIGVGETTKGGVLTNARGLTLYVFDLDKGGVPACYDKCAELWPAVTVAPGSAAAPGFSEVSRNDGKLQLAYKGQPLYTWHKDAAPGETGGDGFRDVWHIAKP